MASQREGRRIVMTVRVVVVVVAVVAVVPADA